MKKAIILHAWFEKPENNWYPWLKMELKKRNYKVSIPNLPTMQTNLPDMQQQLDYVATKFPIDKATVIIGHSLGALLAMRLAEKYSYQRMFLVAGWDFDDLTPEHKLFWKTKINHEKIKKNIKEIYCISSDNDPYFTAYTTNDMSKRLKGECIIIKGAGHFLAKDDITQIPEVLKRI